MSANSFIGFVEMPHQFPGERKTKVWAVQNKKHGDRLGFIQWYRGWRQYCFFPNSDAVFSSGCLRDMVEFCEQRTREQKATVQEPRP